MSCFGPPRSSWGYKIKAPQLSRPAYFCWLAGDWHRASAPPRRLPRSSPWRPGCYGAAAARRTAAGRRATRKSRHRSVGITPIPAPPPVPQHQLDKPTEARSAGAQILDRLVAAEEVEERTQGLPVLAFELRVVFEHQARVVMGDRDQLLMDR